MTTKKCNKCGLDKVREKDFGINKANPDGYKYSCKECESLRYKLLRRKKKIYLSSCYGFDDTVENNYIIKQCEICDKDFYPVRASHKRCSDCTYLVRDTQSHLSSARQGNKNKKSFKCSVKQAIAIVKLLLKSDSCCYCRRNYIEGNSKSIDHIIPVSKGGTHDIKNINICCLQCNLSKRDLILNDWFELCKLVVGVISRKETE